MAKEVALKNGIIPFVYLGHELIHAYHAAYGKNRSREKSICDSMWTNGEEYATIEGRPRKNCIRQCAITGKFQRMQFATNMVCLNE
jgi:hypothetical protein